jgi:hypothetical protein
MRKKVKSQIHSKDAYLALDSFWKAVEPFRSELETEYFRKLVMGLLFIKLSYEIFEHQNEMISQSTSSNRKKALRMFMENRDPSAIGEFIWLPRAARWPTIRANVEKGQNGRVIDEAMRLIVTQNPQFKGSKAPSYLEFEQGNLRKLIAAINRMSPGSEEWTVSLHLGGLYAYWLSHFVERRRKPLHGEPISEGELFTKPSPYSAEDEFYPMGPINYPIPNIKPFFLTPTPTGVLHQYHVGVLFDGTNYLIVYGEVAMGGQGYLKGCRVTPRGQILDPGGFMIQSKMWGHRARVACGKDSKTGQPVYLVVWEDDWTWTSTSVVRGALIRPVGKVEIVVNERTTVHDFILTGQQAIDSHGTMIFPDTDSLNPYVQYPALAGYSEPDVCFNGADFVVTCLTPVGKIIARLIDPSTGSVKTKPDPFYLWGKPTTLSIKTVGPTISDVWRVRINSGGKEQCLVTWSRTASPGIGELSGAKLDFTVGGESWKIGESKVICGTTDPPYSNYGIDSDGNGNYMLAWHDVSQFSKKKTSPQISPNPDLARAAVNSASANPLFFNVNGYTIMFSGSGDYYPQVAFDGQNYLTVWDGFTSDVVNFHPQLGCLVGIVIGAYVTPDSQLLGWFFVKADGGASAQLGSAFCKSVCFGKNEGLLVYAHEPPKGLPPPSNPYKISLIRLRFIGKTT